MKNVAILFLGFILAMAACKKEEKIEESAGHIPGMGNADGELEIAHEFVLPQGVELVNSIQGISVSGAVDVNPDLKSISCYNSYGCYPMDISSIINLINHNNYDQEITIPAGTIFEVVNKDGYQKGIVLQPIVISIRANCTTAYRINLFCLNHGMSGSDDNVVYDIAGITSSDLIIGFVELLRPWYRMEYQFVKEQGEMAQLKVISERIQTELWKITNGEGLTEAEEAELQSFLQQFDFIN